VSDLIQKASDDQIAIALCVAAVVVSSLIMHFSFYVGQAVKSVQPESNLASGKADTIPMRHAPRKEAA
jgi:hypothetical protein